MGRTAPGCSNPLCDGFDNDLFYLCDEHVFGCREDQCCVRYYICMACGKELMVAHCPNCRKEMVGQSLEGEEATVRVFFCIDHVCRMVIYCTRQPGEWFVVKRAERNAWDVFLKEFSSASSASSKTTALVRYEDKRPNIPDVLTRNGFTYLEVSDLRPGKRVILARISPEGEYALASLRITRVFPDSDGVHLRIVSGVDLVKQCCSFLREGGQRTAIVMTPKRHLLVPQRHPATGCIIAFLDDGAVDE